MKKHEIISVTPDSIAEEMELAPGDFLISINGQEIKDILDYRWHTAIEPGECLVMEIEKPNDEIWELEIEAEGDEDLGLAFAPGSMGEDKRCVNACIFCFVDQQPPGLRESLYVKDDDPYQSFVLGNYITLTNLGDDDIRQIVKHRLSPLRVSVHTADMCLRRQMMGSPKAAGLFEALGQFSQAGLDMHFQIVLCNGINDGPGLDYTIERLLTLGKSAKSLAVVPVGLTRYRDGLYPLEPFTKEDANAVISQVEKWQALCREKMGSRFVFLADEWYVLAGKALPRHDEYEDFPQLDNGVGMMALFEDEFREALKELYSNFNPKCGIEIAMASECDSIMNDKNRHSQLNALHLPTHMQAGMPMPIKAKIGIVTGQAAGEFMIGLSRLFMESFPDIDIGIHVIENDFYGPGVTVSGLLTGRDIIAGLKGQCDEVDALFIPENAFRTGTEDMLCGATISDISKALGVKTVIGASDGGEFCRQLLRNYAN
ncbi:MAG: DUF512 domain-containing protein [Defluviitaleaceae bacterium]|nr:DUF512 domain-containing protein [Defluviitaleaceae bacterium]